MHFEANIIHGDSVCLVLKTQAETWKGGAGETSPIHSQVMSALAGCFSIESTLGPLASKNKCLHPCYIVG